MRLTCRSCAILLLLLYTVQLNAFPALQQEDFIIDVSNFHKLASKDSMEHNRDLHRLAFLVSTTYTLVDENISTSIRLKVADEQGDVCGFSPISYLSPSFTTSAVSHTFFILRNNELIFD